MKKNAIDFDRQIRERRSQAQREGFRKVNVWRKRTAHTFEGKCENPRCQDCHPTPNVFVSVPEPPPKPKQELRKPPAKPLSDADSLKKIATDADYAASWLQIFKDMVGKK